MRISNKPKPKLGDTLYAVDCGNLARGCTEPNARWGDVCKVGRLYFYVDVGRFDPIAFYIDTWQEKTEYSANFRLYESDTAYHESKEVTKWVRAISDAFRYGKPDASLADYKAAAEILGITLPDTNN